MLRYLPRTGGNWCVWIHWYFNVHDVHDSWFSFVMIMGNMGRHWHYGHCGQSLLTNHTAGKVSSGWSPLCWWRRCPRHAWSRQSWCKHIEKGGLGPGHCQLFDVSLLQVLILIWCCLTIWFVCVFSWFSFFICFHFLSVHVMTYIYPFILYIYFIFFIYMFIIFMFFILCILCIYVIYMYIIYIYIYDVCGSGVDYLKVIAQEAHWLPVTVLWCMHASKEEGAMWPVSHSSWHSCCLAGRNQGQSWHTTPVPGMWQPASTGVFQWVFPWPEATSRYPATQLHVWYFCVINVICVKKGKGDIRYSVICVNC